ncbi:clathrin adaptor, mu subunit [Linderina pennispora]|uniref:Clathrin adaptor, mu subunit n=1 Tax=Linderina pennispora TaxID=61395 RepID=A0A1Y1WBZ3_9FUNG|nr:clathrin adaptor, mu subunit [Linderina pennispora]ORX70952.1 clathrin adaptor, mu subunit [Linderina pennispora]
MSIFGTLSNHRDPKTKDAAVRHWTDVKAKADPALPLAGLRLTAEQKAKLDELLKGASVFPDEPTEELLLASLVVVPAFTRYLHSVPSFSDAEPVWSSPLDMVCIHIQRGELIYLGVVSHEAPPLEVLELLEGISQALSEYIGNLSELTVKENFATVYQVLSEMVDSGSVVTTDMSVLRGLVPVPNMVNRMIENVSGIGIRSEVKPDINTSSIPWRSQGIRHSSNEFFVDIVEKIDAIVDSSGSVVAPGLSGMPELLMVMNRPEIMDDVSFHPCVRLAKWESERTIAYVPPDGQFKLGSFHVGMGASPGSLPVYVHASCTTQGANQHTIEISAEAGQCGGKSVEKAYNTRVQCKLVIQYSTRPGGDAATNGGGASTPSSITEPTASAVFVDFEIAGFSASSLKVDSLKMLREAYKIFKGVRYVTKAGSYQSSAANIDFDSPEAAQCATRHWGEIVDIINPKIPSMEQYLPSEKMEEVKGLLDGKKELSKDQASVISPVLLNRFGGDIISKCLAEQK